MLVCVSRGEDCLVSPVDLDFGSAAVLQNNLGGYPDVCSSRSGKEVACHSSSEKLRLGAVARSRNGSAVDVEVTSVGAYSKGMTCERGCNGLFGDFLEVNVRVGTFVDLRFDFVDGDGATVSLEAFYLTIADLDDLDDGRQEGVCVNGLVSAVATGGEVDVQRRETTCDGGPGTSTTFASTAGAARRLWASDVGPLDERLGRTLVTSDLKRDE